jgi:hypothetical protein
MTTTNLLGLPYIDGSQAQKHVTHNEALRMLDAVIQVAVLDITRTAPPASPSQGERHIVAAGAIGAWTGRDRSIASYIDGAWQFMTPHAGWCAWSIADDYLVVFDGTIWRDARNVPVTIDNAPHIGINTTASSPNLLSVKSNAALLAAITAANGGTGDARLQLSKELAANTASVVFSNAFSGRAEFGLAGDDDFHLKVSADGSTWVDAFKVSRSSGKVSFLASGGPREVLMANRTYYVRTNGSDSNNGLANTSGGALLTVQKAVDVALGTLDFNGCVVTIQLADGTYTGATSIGSGVGLTSPASLVIQGNATTPGNVVLNPASGSMFLGVSNALVTIKDMELGTAAVGTSALRSESGAQINFSNIRFASGGTHLITTAGGRIQATGNYAIVSSAGLHIQCTGTGGYVRISGVTVTLIGTPAFSQVFASVSRLGLIDIFSNTYSGSATGPRYSADSNGVIFTSSAGAAVLPGNAAGSVANGGQYV